MTRHFKPSTDYLRWQRTWRPDMGCTFFVFCRSPLTPATWEFNHPSRPEEWTPEILAKVFPVAISRLSLPVGCRVEEVTCPTQ